MFQGITKSQLKDLIVCKLREMFSTTPAEASDELFYKTLCTLVKEELAAKRRNFVADNNAKGGKKVYYLCIEFLLGRSLKNSIFNLGVNEVVADTLKEFNVSLDNIYEYEPDAGLGNGGLGRLAACFLDGLATNQYPATGYSICYEFGIFKQKIIEGWQTELPDNWLPGGDIWLTPRFDQSVEIHFGGELVEKWDNEYHSLNHVNYTTVKAIPYDMYITGYDSKGVSMLRLWKSSSPGLDMDLFNRGEYLSAVSQNSTAEVISKVLYPNDNHLEGKRLRLMQQYFLCAASIADIVREHLEVYQTLENLHEKVAIHINDTHPALAVPELMRLLLDECGMTWEQSWDIVTKTFAYTNHTVMSEALEVWNEDLFCHLLPRIYQIIAEVNRRYCLEVEELSNGDQDKVRRMSIILNHSIKMANLSIAASHSVNGVSALHSQIIKDQVFQDPYSIYPDKFKNVTNGIASRRWLLQSNPALTNLLEANIGSGFKKDMLELEKFRKFQDDKSVLAELAKIKKSNKERLAKYVKEHNNISMNIDSIFDVQVKRLHEYKRQHLNALHILSLYQQLLENPNADVVPKTFIFGAKAAPGYYLAKQIIRFISTLSAEINKNKAISEKLQVVYLEDYRVTLSELLMPASEVSEQISLAGTEASGTGNMKFMLNGALTLGTLDGANIEIKEHCGDDNIFIFGMNTPQVNQLKAKGYHPADFYQNHPTIKKAIDLLYRGFGGHEFSDIANSLSTIDPYMVLADFQSYADTQNTISNVYKDANKWNKMSVNNIAGSGFFCADRSIDDYARDIWGITKQK